MKLAILCQEEPISLGPFLQRVIAMRPESIAAVFIAGRRGAGEPSKSWKERITALRIFWLIMEPVGFWGALFLRLRARLLGRYDPQSVERTARRCRVPVHRVGSPNHAAFHELLRAVAPDAILNQSEFLLKSEVLSIPRLGFLNRHASLLPHFRGRMACFRSHAAESPRYGVTIHFVDEGVDTGSIIAQRELQDLDTRRPYPEIMKRVFAIAPALFWDAVDRLGQEGFEPLPNTPVDEPFRFPMLAEARQYRERMRQRRRSVR